MDRRAWESHLLNHDTLMIDNAQPDARYPGNIEEIYVDEHVQYVRVSQSVSTTQTLRRSVLVTSLDDRPVLVDLLCGRGGTEYYQSWHTPSFVGFQSSEEMTLSRRRCFSSRIGASIQKIRGTFSRKSHPTGFPGRIMWGSAAPCIQTRRCSGFLSHWPRSGWLQARSRIRCGFQELLACRAVSKEIRCRGVDLFLVRNVPRPRRE